MDGVERPERRSAAFVRMTIERVNGSPRQAGPDTAFCAAMRRADNPATEYQSWEYLSRWCDLDRERDRRPFAVVAAAIARDKPKADGVLSIGKAVSRSYSDDGQDNGHTKDAAKAKMRRLLACSSVEEACAILRPLLGLVASRGGDVNYSALLDDLLTSDERFCEWIKPKWANDFYGRRME